MEPASPRLSIDPGRGSSRWTGRAMGATCSSTAETSAHRTSGRSRSPSRQRRTRSFRRRFPSAPASSRPTADGWPTSRCRQAGTRSTSVHFPAAARGGRSPGAAGLLNHPNITAVYDIGSHEGAPYVVSELLEGETLRAELAGDRLSPRKAIDYAIQLAQGLAAAHEKGIVHRDLKPENVFVTRNGRVKILDFGLAKLKQPEEGTDKTDLATATVGTEPGVVLGTMGYMSPEQVRGKPADYRSDIFAFGAILYEMLSGKRAFHGDTAADTMSAILTK